MSDAPLNSPNQTPFEDSAGHDPSCLTWEKMKARHGLGYEGVSRFYRRAAAVIKALELEP